MNNILNYIIVVLMVLGFIYVIYYLKRKSKEYKTTQNDINIVNFEYGILVRKVERKLNSIIYARVEDMQVSFSEARKREEQKIKLSDAKRDAPVGSEAAKTFLISEFAIWLQNDFMIDEVTIDLVFPFNNKEKLDPHTKFLTLMFTVMKTHGINTWDWLVHENHLAELRENGRYEIYQSDIDMMFTKYVKEIPYLVKLDVLTQRIYEDKIGHGKTDILFGQNIEDITIGHGGRAVNAEGYLSPSMDGSDESTAAYNKVVILFSGKNVHHNFCGLGSQKELERVCRHIYQYDNPGELSEETGYIENNMADGSRVVVNRNSFGDSWGVCVRKKHKSGRLRTLEECYKVEEQKNADYVHALLTALMEGCQSSIVTGPMYSGKTTLLIAMCERINPNYNLRALESVFELDLREAFPTRDVSTFLEKTDLPGDKVLEFLKRTNGTVLLLGELLKERASNWLISACQSGFKFVLSTTHAINTKALIEWLLNAKLNTSGAGDIKLATKNIVNAIHFNVHCGLDEINGERYLEYVDEIVPLENSETMYEISRIIEYDKENHTYKLCQPLSLRTLNEMYPYIKGEKWEKIIELFGKGYSHDGFGGVAF